MSASQATWPMITQADFQKISRFAHDHFGLELPAGKEGLVNARLGKKMRQGGFATFADYYSHVHSDRTGQALLGLIDALTTNFTAFLREPAHFDFLRQAAAEFRDARPLRVWSAACSSGEEPYSIAMTLLAAGRDAVEITASDISTRVLKVGQDAVYPAERFRGIPEEWRRAFLLKGTGPKEGSFKIKPRVAGLIKFERRNLMEPLPSRKFHFIFCRNVMIYFNRATQQSIVERFTPCLEPGGYLFVGHSESLNGIQHTLRYIKPSVYKNERIK
ncbi:MAG: protein-glutamate O-methyltransferase CheR [Acidobacteriia bacterium]|nr:protein-glutamate O-methyltransferase CheR [Terriglobia bacterium]